jgi:MarR family transcriptional regulator, multiple antibiotic resistance protein MarR
VGRRATHCVVFERSRPRRAGLESRGYLRRVPDPDDRRGTVIRLTPQGRKLTTLIHATASAIQQEWAHQSGRSRMGELIALLNDLDAIAGQREHG